jgi:hypothetical protein
VGGGTSQHDYCKEGERKMERIKRLPLYLVSLSAVAMALSVSSVNAQELSDHDLCRNTTTNPMESLGDRDGHALSTGMDSCETVEGVAKGAIWTNSAIWEWDGPKAKELTGWAIGRKAGATQFCQDQGTLELIMTDGKVTGWKASGQCLVTMATGDWASMVGKTWYWTDTPTGPMTNEIHSVIK